MRQSPPTRTKALNRALIEAGLITMRDSPNGKRYGRRDDMGRIIEAYGFDLSPLATRHAEFVRLAGEMRAEREAMRRLRRRATIARSGIVQILATATDHGLRDEEWPRLAREIQAVTRALRTIEQPEEMTFAVEGLERRWGAARERLEKWLAEAAMAAPDPVNPDPMGTESGPHSYTYKSSPDPDQDTVVAREASNGPDRGDSPPDHATLSRVTAEKGRVLKLVPDELVRLAPRLKPYLRRSDPTWPEIVDAADWLRHELDVSRPLWGEACLAMGREQAALALAIVSTKNASYFRTTAGGYFHGMVARARRGQLNLDRTLWAMRRASEPRPARRAEREGGRTPPPSWH